MPNLYDHMPRPLSRIPQTVRLLLCLGGCAALSQKAFRVDPSRKGPLLLAHRGVSLTFDPAGADVVETDRHPAKNKPNQSRKRNPADAN